MLDIINTVSQSNEVSLDNEKLDIDGIHSYICNRSVNNFGLLSKYIVFDYSELKIQGILESVEAFVSFQRRYIGSIFYNYRDDIRWNIYVIIVCPNSFTLDNVIASIEKNDEYSRKIFMSEDDFIDFIKYGILGNIEHKSSSTLRTDILLIWDDELAKIGLNGCLYNKFESKPVLDFITSGKKILPVGRPSQRSQYETPMVAKKNKLTIQSIENLKIDGFRSHCLGPSLDLTVGKMNLLSGSNGCGKSSICEAIACALTGNIDDKYGTIVANCINADGSHVSHKSKKSSNDQRTLDLLWYGTVTIGYKSSLYKNFRIFNYLDTTLQNDEKINLNEILKNVIYGEDTVEARKLLNRYYEEFSTHLKSQQREQKEIDDYIQELFQKREQDSQYIVNTVDLRKDFIEIGFHEYSTDKLNEIDYFGNLKDQFSHLASDVEALKDYLADKYELNTIYDINDRLCKCKSEYNDVQEKTLDENRVISELEIINKQQVENEIDKKKYEQSILEYSTVRNTFMRIGDIRNSDQDSINTFVSDFQRTQRKLEQLIGFQTEFRDVYNESKIEYSEEDLVNLNTIICEIRKNITELIDTIEEKKGKMSSFLRLKSDLFEIGKKALHDNSISTACPLCNYSYATRSELENAIAISIDLSDSYTQEISELEKKRESLENTLYEKSKTQIEMDTALGRSRMRTRYFKTLYENYGIKCDGLTLNDINDLVNNVIADFTAYISQNKYTFDILDEIMKSQIYNSFLEMYDKSTFLSFLERNLKEFSSSLSTIKDKIDLVNKDKSLLDCELTIIYDNKTKLINLGSNINEFNVVLSAIEKIKNSFPTISNSQNLREWIIKFTNIVKYMEQIFINLISTNERIHLDELINEQNRKLEEVLRKIKSCKTVTNIISSLPTLEDNMHEFISENAARIEHIFKLIHRPKEFSDLKIEDGEISFTRESTKEKTKSDEISTGQNISLMFSIMLCLYLSAPNAPQLLILDEPVANMDDMHILNLVDILRELILRGTQIFFTTANNQVASFLRRKFSFFGCSFKHYFIERNDINPSTITEISYQYNNEEPIIIKRYA